MKAYIQCSYLNIVVIHYSSLRPRLFFNVSCIAIVRQNRSNFFRPEFTVVIYIACIRIERKKTYIDCIVISFLLLSFPSIMSSPSSSSPPYITVSTAAKQSWLTEEQKKEFISTAKDLTAGTIGACAGIFVGMISSFFPSSNLYHSICSHS